MKALEERCIQEHLPPCASICPVHVDVRGMIHHIQKDNLEKAFELFRQKVIFPGLIAHLCDHPCESACNRVSYGGALAVNQLELYCYRILKESGSKAVSAGIPKPFRYHNKSVALLGSGLRGLAAAHVLLEKGYKVTVFERSPVPGGSLGEIPEEILPAQVRDSEFSRFSETELKFHFSSPLGLTELRELTRDFDAVIVSFRDREGLLQPLSLSQESTPLQEKTKAGADKVFIETFETGIKGLFSLPDTEEREGGYSPILKIREGKGLAISAERFLKGVSLSSGRENEGSYTTALYTNLKGKQPVPRMVESDPQGEAERCFQCSCLECVKECVYLQHFESYPKSYIREISNNLSIVFGIKTAKPLINSCSLCGLCEKLCPTKVNMGEISLSARNTMWKKGTMPPAIHDFPIRDMLFSNESRAILSRHQSGTDTSDFIFFPGCQLAGLSPGHVVSVYDYLVSLLPERTGLMLGCCGAPAKWAGREELYRETLKDLRDRWTSLGKPRIITACSSCKAVLLENLPGESIVSLWEIIAEKGLPSRIASRNKPLDGTVMDVSMPEEVAVLDPCTAREDKATQKSVRSILSGLGIKISEIASSGEYTKCCGFGGLTVFAAPGIASEMVSKRLAESGLPMAAYCAVCREAFSGKGRAVWHILDFLFPPAKELGYPEYSPLGKGPGFSERQDNRIRLKRDLLYHFWGESMEEQEEEKTEFKLFIDKEVGSLLEERLILKADIRAVIEQAEKTGKKILLSDKKRYAAHLKPGIITYWVEYSPEGKGYRIHNAYSHRLSIEE